MDQDTSLGGLIRQARLDVQRLVAAQVALVQAELRESGRAIGLTTLLILGALASVSAAGLFLLVTLALGIAALGLPVWAGFGIVTLLLILGAIGLAFLGRRSARQIQPPTLLAGLGRGRSTGPGAPPEPTPGEVDDMPTAPEADGAGDAHAPRP